jgi:hypothetical protein
MNKEEIRMWLVILGILLPENEKELFAWEEMNKDFEYQITQEDLDKLEVLTAQKMFER